MIESFLTHEMIISGEPALDDYLRSDQLDFTSIKDESFNEMLKDLIDQNLDIKKLCKRLSLQTSVTKTAVYTGVKSDEDYAQRLRLVIDVTAITGAHSFTLQGTDNDGVNYYDVSTGLTLSKKGVYTYLISGMYKKYRLNLVVSGTTITYSSYMIEEQYTILHRLKTRADIYHSLMAAQGDMWQGKFEQYLMKYEKSLSDTKFHYDEDDSGEISEGEGESNINENVVWI
jgi:hypothetical protein